MPAGCRVCSLPCPFPRCNADVNGALRAGLAAAVWINRNGERPVPTGLRPAAILSSVLELPSALEQLQLLPQRAT